MFEIPQAVLDAWEQDGDPKASEADVLKIEAASDMAMPEAYREFVKTHGFVQFGTDPDMTSWFQYMLEQPDGIVERSGSIAYLYDAETVIDVTRRLQGASPGDALPILPKELVAVGANEDGESQIVVHPATGRVYFIPEVQTQSGEDMVIGFVAEDFAGFVNALAPAP